ncbi:uncharacterized protein SPPG_01923 [Spizellomyces punctatus DAOM BR117]|uniref:HMG box domain-containing protein n=1 Tax=Spizellomyces punctatus (strain DAOM BR117) TaxID=645134 RepID=A0A0L0HP56_SPIPD|nr:uncharacterized protein SPPG_01923 [Spizellomyces punctatus DAOM BR117]KND02843.1 hypothetical protein SPPG_01923 [Spizellomyces punctatus DAOM BR117]|eukprot:XP_016610882.1 hypothetical protein SPPG_01923 [Spizellomyces punctatus DAOM BR117]
MSETPLQFASPPALASFASVPERASFPGSYVLVPQEYLPLMVEHFPSPFFSCVKDVYAAGPVVPQTILTETPLKSSKSQMEAFASIVAPVDISLNSMTNQIDSGGGGPGDNASNHPKPQLSLELGNSSGVNRTKSKPRAGPSHKPEALNKRWRTPRPLNPFIIYRREKHTYILARNHGIPNNEISKLVGQMWANEPESVKSVYRQRSEEEKRIHQLKHPGYRFAPRKHKPKRPKKSISCQEFKDRPAGHQNLRASRAHSNEDSVEENTSSLSADFIHPILPSHQCVYAYHPSQLQATVPFET